MNKLTTFASAFLIAACGGGSKKTDTPKPDTTATTDTSAGGATADKPAQPEKPAEPAKPAKPAAPDTGGFKMVRPAALTYAPVDPKNPSPEAAFVNGDPQKGGSLFLRIAPGGKPGIHTHTADYHAVVISGTPKHWLVGGEKAAKPLGAGSYWFQPGGQAHGDECAGKEPCVLFIVMTGAFDMTPAPKAKASPVGNYVLKPRKDQKYAPVDPKKPDGLKAAFVFGDPKTGPVGAVLEVPPNANSGLHSHTSDYQAVVIDGAPAHWLAHEANEGEGVEPGTFWFQPGGYDHGDRCTSTTACHAFVLMDKAMDFKPAAAKK